MQIRYMHKLSMRETVKGIGAKKWKYELQFKGLEIKQLCNFSDIWTINLTHNNFFAHEFKMRLNLFKLFLILLKETSPCSENIIFTIYCLFYIISTQTIYIYQTFHYMNGFVKLKCMAKFKYFKILYKYY
jgi:hypothetical protein